MPVRDDVDHDGADDRPPICPACGVTTIPAEAEDGSIAYVCLECGFSDGDHRPSEP